MRYAVTFANRRYLEIHEALLKDPEHYRIPEGVYRQLAVVVDADSPREAVRKARQQLGWPDGELDLVPMGVASQEEVRASIPTGQHPAFF